MSDVHEQHDLEAMKSWWKANGMAVLTGGALAIAAIVGWQTYQSYQSAQQMNASARYEQITSMAEQQGVSSIKMEAKQLMLDHADSPYAVATAFMLAKQAAEQAEWDDAQAHLRWVMTHRSEGHWHDLASIRLARVLIESNKANESLTLLAQEYARMGKAFQGMADYLRGLAYLSLQQPVEAEKAFAQAKANEAMSTSVRSLSQLWIDDLAQVKP